MPRDDFYPTPPNSIDSEKMTSRRYYGVQKKSSPPLVREFRIVRPVRPFSKLSFGQPILLFVTAKPWSLRWHAVALLFELLNGMHQRLNLSAEIPTDQEGR